MLLEGEVPPQNMHDAPSLRSVEVQDDVRRAFGWSEDEDLSSARAMQKALEYHVLWNPVARLTVLHELRETLVQAKRVVIIGAAVTKKEIDTSRGDGVVYIAADGAVGAMDSYQKLACIVSDFDGANYLEKAAQSGQVIVAHAHGDNQQRWHEAIQSWSSAPTPPQLILSHQVNPVIDGMHNFGGFTDGDRALCLALSLGVRRENINLIGFSIKNVGVWSGTTVAEQKMKKLQWMNDIVAELGFGQWVQ